MSASASATMARLGCMRWWQVKDYSRLMDRRNLLELIDWLCEELDERDERKPEGPAGGGPSLTPDDAAGSGQEGDTGDEARKLRRKVKSLGGKLRGLKEAYTERRKLSRVYVEQVKKLKADNRELQSALTLAVGDPGNAVGRPHWPPPLSDTQQRLLRAIRARPLGVEIGHLREGLHLGEQAVTQHLGFLKKHHLIRRESERARTVAISAAGRWALRQRSR